MLTLTLALTLTFTLPLTFTLLPTLTFTTFILISRSLFPGSPRRPQPSAAMVTVT